MKRKVSPLFTVIAILFALAAGAVWFLFSYRTDAARRAEHGRMLQQEAERNLLRQEEAGRAGRVGRPGMRGPQTSSQGSSEGREGASSRAPGEGSGRGRAPGAGPTGDDAGGGE